MELNTDSFEFGQKFAPFDELEGDASLEDPIYYVDTQPVTIDDEDLDLAFFLVPDPHGYSMIAIILGEPEVSGFDLFHADDTEEIIQDCLADTLGDLSMSVALSEDGMQGSNYLHMDIFNDLAEWFIERFENLPELDI